MVIEHSEVQCKHMSYAWPFQSWWLFVLIVGSLMLSPNDHIKQILLHMHKWGLIFTLIRLTATSKVSPVWWVKTLPWLPFKYYTCTQCLKRRKKYLAMCLALLCSSLQPTNEWILMPSIECSNLGWDIMNLIHSQVFVLWVTFSLRYFYFSYLRM